jgi:hypothetical protein
VPPPAQTWPPLTDDSTGPQPASPSATQIVPFAAGLQYLPYLSEAPLLRTGPNMPEYPQNAPDAANLPASIVTTGTGPEIVAEVEAVLCPEGHVNPLTAGLCRVCSAMVPAQLPRLARRPLLGVLRLPHGETVALDRTVVVGRDPTPDVAGTTSAHLVRIPSADGGISRSHVVISTVDWDVLITDLGSVNGTVVTPPWQQPQRLPPHVALPVVPGSTITLADAVSLRIESV